MKEAFEWTGYFFCEIAFGIWGSGTKRWSRLLRMSNKKLAWLIARPIYIIGNYFYSKGY